MRTSGARSTTHPPNAPDRKALSAWMIMLAATAASTYALDALATAGGVLLVTSQLLSGLDHPLVLALLDVGRTLAVPSSGAQHDAARLSRGPVLAALLGQQIAATSNATSLGR
jgi:hypothetical protein